FTPGNPASQGDAEKTPTASGGGSAGFAFRGHQEGDTTTPAQGMVAPAESVFAVPVSASEVLRTASFRLVTRPDQLVTVAGAVERATLVGIDLETTGLNPRTDRTRLISLACDNPEGGQEVYLVDCFATDPTPLFDVLSSAALVNHNIGFDLGFLRHLGF